MKRLILFFIVFLVLNGCSPYIDEEAACNLVLEFEKQKENSDLYDCNVQDTGELWIVSFEHNMKHPEYQDYLNDKRMYEAKNMTYPIVYYGVHKSKAIIIDKMHPDKLYKKGIFGFHAIPT